MSHSINRCVRALAVAILVLAGGAGCGGSPSAPTLPILQAPGAYWLDLAGYSIAFNPEVPPCIQESGNVLLAVRARVDVSTQRGLWVGKTPSDIGDLMLTIRGGEEVAEGIEVRGSVAGTAVDTTSVLPRRGFLEAPDVSIRLAGPTGSAATVTGVAERTGRSITGTISGDIRFFNSLGSVSRCTAVTWRLEPAS
jgi:hypothetical protein